jgi:hypothetical protein
LAAGVEKKYWKVLKKCTKKKRKIARWLKKIRAFAVKSAGLFIFVFKKITHINYETILFSTRKEIKNGKN